MVYKHSGSSLFCESWGPPLDFMVHFLNKGLLLYPKQTPTHTRSIPNLDLESAVFFFPNSPFLASALAQLLACLKKQIKGWTLRMTRQVWCFCVFVEVKLIYFKINLYHIASSIIIFKIFVIQMCIDNGHQITQYTTCLHEQHVQTKHLLPTQTIGRVIYSLEHQTVLRKLAVFKKHLDVFWITPNFHELS